MRTFVLFFLMIFVSFAQAHAQAEAHADHGISPETLGSVHFTTSCGAEAQSPFNRAVALMHSFQFANAIAGFQAVLATDPACSMAYWGIALSNWGNPFAAGLKLPAQLEHGWSAVEKARAVKPKTERERAYIEAVAQLFGETAAHDQHARMLAYEKGMAEVSAANPDDTEAEIFYALALAAAADPADKTYAKQLKAGAMLEKLFVQFPNHPGLAHYIIHTYDNPALAARAVNAAQRYGAIAPSTPHALHMPSHTFTRVGDWRASIEANIASAASARKGGQPADELHAMDYLVYAYLQTAQDGVVRSLVESAVAMFSRFDPKMTVGGAGGPAAAYFAHAAIPARYCLERKDWAGAAKLEPLASPYPYTDAMTYFARGLGAAHLKNQAGAESAVQNLARLHDALVASKELYWAGQVEIQRREVAAWQAFSGGDRAGALAGMTAAAALEDQTEKNAITPGPLAPARELLAELLLASGKPAEARKEYEATLTKEPNRFWSLYGAAESAKLAGDGAAARASFAKLLTIVRQSGQAAQPERAEVAEAQRDAAGSGGK